MKRKLTSLPSDLTPRLLQGVPLSICLSGCGQHWAAPRSYTDDFYSTRRFCQRTENFDVFLSHDWGTSRWLKLCSLLMMFNVRAASTACMVVSIAVGILRAYRIIPDERWTELFPLGIFYILLFFWQHLRELFKKPLVVFLDRLCIAQNDDRLKEQGILGLAGFLDRSSMLAVLWSPRYFKRAWCAYELGTFLRDPGKEKLVRVMPVKLAPTLLAFCLTWEVIRFAHSAATEYDESGSREWLIVSGTLLFVILCGSPLYMYIGMGLIRDVQALPDHLRNFKIQDAECSCCANNHRNPSTGEELPCDKQLIFRTLKKWYGTPDDDTEAHLETFNGFVRSRLSRTIRQTVGGYTLPLKQYLYIALGSNAPLLANYMSKMGTPPAEISSDLERVMWACRWLIRWMNAPLQMLFGIWVSIACWKLGVYLMRYCGRVALSLILPFLILPCALAVAWLPMRITFDLTSHDSLLPLVPFLALLAITLCLFSAGASPKMIAPDTAFDEMLRARSDKSQSSQAKEAWEKKDAQDSPQPSMATSSTTQDTSSSS
ncbi:unnamed protein product [Symbiodinium natans]|uniref:TIR domain-containing protein n=1 Tax=Symbiodinium natans TaxID=878477 RepID=A0A812K898_9DINO|nr:unnamed protein product [Symbiodinium natans]